MPEKDIGLWMTIHNALKEQGIAIILVSVLTAIRMCREGEHPNFMDVIMDSLSAALTVFAVGLACKEFGLFMDGC